MTSGERSAYFRGYYLLHKEKILKKNRKWTHDHPEYYADLAKKRYWGNRDEILDAQFIKKHRGLGKAIKFAEKKLEFARKVLGHIRSIMERKGGTHDLKDGV